MTEYKKAQYEKLEDPLLKKTADILNGVYALIGRPLADIKGILNEDNPHVKKLLDAAQNIDPNAITSVTQNEEGLKINFPTENDVTNSIIYPKTSPVYRAIFWPEIKAEEDRAKAAALTSLDANRAAGELRTGVETKAALDDLNPGEVNVFATLLKQRVEAAETLKEADTTKIQNSLIKDIRLNRNLLTENPGTTDEEKIANLKDETARRVSAYTTQGEDGWYTLDYKKMKSDKKGLSHEKYVGLGDILLDEDINVISVKREGAEESFTAYRGFTKEGRPCFLTEDDKYVATFTGDQFKIGEDESNEETNPKNPDAARNYMEKIKDTETKSKPYREDLEENGLRSKASYIYENVEIGGESEVGKQKPLSEDTIIARLNKKREKLDKTQDGAEIVAYAKKVCTDEFNIPWPIFKELIDVESNWDMGAAYKGPKKSNAAGLGQFIGSTWNGKEDDGEGGFVKSRKGKTHPPEWGLDPDHQLDRDDRFNPYVMLYATAWLMNQTKEQFHLEGKPLHEQGIIYYLSHHEGSGGVEGYMKLLSTIEADGKAAGKTIRTQRDVREQYLENQDKYKALLEDGARDRLEKYGIDDFLSIYFAKAVRIGARAAATDTALVEKIHQARVESGAESREYFPSGDKQLEQRVEKGEAAEGEINEEYFEKNKKGEEFLRAILKVKGGQDRWIFGSSIAVQTDTYRKGKTGVFGIGGFRSGNFLQVLEQKWSQLEPLEKPKEVVLLGLVHNEQERSPQGVMDNYMKIVTFLKSKGINNVKIAVAHEYPEQTGTTIPDFNALLRSDKYKEYCLETNVTAAKKLHLNADENRKLMTGIENI